MESKLTGRGGPGRGQGRKPLGPDPLQRTTIRLTADQIEQLKRLGAGNLSEGIRRLLAQKGEQK